MSARPPRASWTYLPEHARAQTPRYTSYPPANRFGALGSADKAQALRALPAGANLSLYLHIPYCRKLCWYCGCHTSVPTRADPLGGYLDALEREIARVALDTPASARVTRIHFGGGSPDILSPAGITRIFKTLRGAFTLLSSAEIAAELDPRGLTPAVTEAFVNAGLTRASLGVQVLDRGVQSRINRIQSRERIEAAARALRAARVALNMDVMYGLPGQTREHVIETALFAASEDADRIAVFGYAHVPWMKRHQKGIRTEDLPTGEVRFRQAEAAALTLEGAGYQPIGFDHFAAPGDALALAEREGRLRRNFQGYTDDDATALIGLGASAISSFPGAIIQNTPDTSAYRERVAAGDHPAARGVRLTEGDRRTASVIERLLCDFEVEPPQRLLAAAAAGLAPFAADGLVAIKGRKVTVTARGRPYVRNIAAAFDPDFSRATARHSVAI
jgi:oxygen-independent coproporphyrinogen III oxidase